VKIAKVLGTDDLFVYLEKYEIELDSHFDGLLGQQQKKEWNKFVTPENQAYAPDDSLSFLDGLLRYDHHQRLTAKQAMEHPYFGTFLPQVKVFIQRPFLTLSLSFFQILLEIYQRLFSLVLFPASFCCSLSFLFFSFLLCSLNEVEKNKQ
jgi:serine/threonine protein kinase